MLRPSSVIAPSSGLSAPATRLMVVVLPEPFGPMRPTISPRRNSAEKSSTAAMPPKRLESALAAKYGASGGFDIFALHGAFALHGNCSRVARRRRDAPVEM